MLVLSWHGSFNCGLVFVHYMIIYAKYLYMCFINEAVSLFYNRSMCIDSERQSWRHSQQVDELSNPRDLRKRGGVSGQATREAMWRSYVLPICHWGRHETSEKNIPGVAFIFKLQTGRGILIIQACLSYIKKSNFQRNKNLLTNNIFTIWIYV
jgi:hypothetical protein